MRIFTPRSKLSFDEITLRSSYYCTFVKLALIPACTEHNARIVRTWHHFRPRGRIGADFYAGRENRVLFQGRARPRKGHPGLSLAEREMVESRDCSFFRPLARY